MSKPKKSAPLIERCPWAADELMWSYHDTEWGVPVHDDRTHFEFLILEGAQAGLSWATVLRKREAYRQAFAEFDPEKVARFNAAKIEKLVQNPGIIRNRLKVESTVTNAKAFLKLREEIGSFDEYIWRFVGGKPIQNSWNGFSDVPAQTPLAVEVSKALKARGFKFVGPVIVYAWMQAVGMVNDHFTCCHRHEAVKGLVR